jgi:hypothetical protein
MWIKIRNRNKKPLVLPFAPSDIIAPLNKKAFKASKEEIDSIVKFIEKQTGRKVQSIDIQLAVVNWKMLSK